MEPSTLVVERTADAGTIGMRMRYGHHHIPLGYTTYRNKEHSLRIILDGREVGIFSSPGTLERPLRKEFDIEAGHHTLTIDIKRVGGLQGLLITLFVIYLNPATASFDIAPKETVTFSCTFNHPLRISSVYVPASIRLIKK